MSANKQALLDSAESTIGILENIAGFEPSDIDGDAVELRFETDGGFDTGCDVSIVDQCQKAADVIRALLDELEAADKYAKERDAENEDLMLTVGRLRVEKEAAEKRIAELTTADGNLIAWESTTPVYIKFITDERYRRLRPGYQKWYKPYCCSNCAAGITVKGE